MGDPQPQIDDTRRDARLRRLLETWFEQEESEAEPDLSFLRGEDPLVVERFVRLIGRSDDVLAAWGKNGAGGDLPVGRLGPYRLLREIGSGGMGRVFAAEDESLGRRAAVKVLHAGTAATPAQRARFRREAEIVAALEHPNVVPVYGAEEDGAWLYIAMKLIEGPSLAERAPVPPAEAARVGADVARALHEAHAHGILHRDVKPSNVRMDGDVPVLLDFGLARPLAGGVLTGADVVPGTLPYMSPEQVAGERMLDPRTDVYSLGATLHELVSGAPPFDPGAPREVLLRRVLERDPPSLGLPRADRDLETIVRRALEKDPRHRFPDARAMADDLERCRRGLPIRSRSSGPLSRGVKLVRRHRRVAATVAVLGVVAVASLGALVVRAIEEEAALERDLAAVDRRIARGDLQAAGDVLRVVAGRGTKDRRVEARRRRLAARTALEDLLDGLHDFSAVRTPGRIEHLQAVLGRAAPEDLARPTADLARALACLHLKDGAACLRALDALPPGAAGCRADRALRAVVSGSVPQLGSERPGGSPAEVAEQHVFCAMALRLAGAPVEEQWEEVQRAFAAHPADHRVLLARARVLLDLGRADHALGIYESLHRDEDHRPVVALAAARACLDLGDVASAQAWLERAPGGAEVLRHSVRADLMRHTGDSGYGDFVREAVRRWPGDPEFLRLLGQHLHAEGELEEAARHLEAARERALIPDERALLDVRLLEIRHRRLTAADAWGPEVESGLRETEAGLRRIVAAQPAPYTEAAARYLLGRTLELLDGAESAIPHLRAAYGLDPTHADAVFAHARLLAAGVAGHIRQAGFASIPAPLCEEARTVLDRLEADLEAGRAPQPADATWLAVQLAAALPQRGRLERAAERLDRLDPPASGAQRRARDWLLDHHPDRR